MHGRYLDWPRIRVRTATDHFSASSGLNDCSCRLRADTPFEQARRVLGTLKPAHLSVDGPISPGLVLGVEAQHKSSQLGRGW